MKSLAKTMYSLFDPFHVARKVKRLNKLAENFLMKYFHI